MAVDKKMSVLDYKAFLVLLFVVLMVFFGILFFEWQSFKGHVLALDKLRTDYALRVKKMEKMMSALKERIYCSVCLESAKSKKKSF